MNDKMADMITDAMFRRAFSDVMLRTLEIAVVHGFWDTDTSETTTVKLMLAVSELSEAVEALRDGNPSSEKISGFSHVEEELADAAIRIMGLCARRGWDLPGAILAKIEYNQSRPRMHGRKF